MARGVARLSHAITAHEGDRIWRAYPSGILPAWEAMDGAATTIAAPWGPEMRPRGERRIIALADGGFDLLEAKTAVGVIRYAIDPVVAVVDHLHAGKHASDVVGVGNHIPIVATVGDALALHPDANTLLLGTAPRGGVLPASWRAQIVQAMRAGLDVINGLHAFLSDDAELAPVAAECGVTIWDARRAPDAHRVADTRAHALAATVVLTVGSDCNVGKMSTALEVDALLRKRERNSVFVPTGQTGIMIAGWGTSIDEVISDFTAGAAEDLVMEAAKTATTKEDIILVEGQGSLVHPGYSGVTLSLIHGSAPDALILCHQSTRTQIRRYTLPIPSLADLVSIHGAMTAHVKPAPVIAISLNTHGMSEADAHAAVARATAETGLPATDPVRYGPGVLADAIEAFAKARAATM